jgi:hypothetical protein
MNIPPFTKHLSNVIYAIGVLFFTALVGMWVFGGNTVLFPDAMLPYTLREQSFIWMAAGAVPMILASMAVYKYNAVKTSAHKKRNLALIFAPGFVCCGCLLFILAILAIMFVQAIIHLVNL